MLLYAVLIHRTKRTEDFSRRLRVLRNLVDSSENEIRIERMPDFLAEVDTLVLGEDLKSVLASVKTFNQAQVADEQRKLAFLEAYPDETAAVHLLEDHRLLRGTLSTFELEPNTLSRRAAAFTRVFENKSSWHELAGALLACGDYSRRQSNKRFLFGSPKLESAWRTLLTGPAKSPFEDIRQPIAELLDRVAARECPLSETYQDIVDVWLAMRVEASDFDWRYYLVKYSEMREGASGLFVTESKEMGYALCALKAIQLNSHYRDPFLLAILRQSGAGTDQVYDPLFTGLQNVPRWMRIRCSEIGMRCVANGLALQVPLRHARTLTDGPIGLAPPGNRGRVLLDYPSARDPGPAH